MSTFPYSGAGSPEELGTFADLFDAGAGAPEAFTGFPDPPLALGAGDPLLFSDVTFVFSFSYGGVWSPTSENWSPLRFPDPGWLSQEGGYLVQVESTGVELTNEPYRIDFRDAAGQSHPILEPGAYSGIQGGSTELYAEQGKLSLICAAPPLPLGEYDLVITDSIGATNVLSRVILAVPMPGSSEVESIRAGIPSTVYPGAFPDRGR